MAHDASLQIEMRFRLILVDAFLLCEAQVCIGCLLGVLTDALRCCVLALVVIAHSFFGLVMVFLGTEVMHLLFTVFLGASVLNARIMAFLRF